MGRERDAARTRALSISSNSDSDFESDDDTSRETYEMAEEEVEIEEEEEEEAEEEAQEDQVYGGLAAEELADERLFAGDTIEYYSMAFVFGDPRGYRVAKVLKVAAREREYPLRLDSQEMLPNTLMIKRKLSRRGEELEPGASVWRKIRTFGLVDGEVKGKTRADLLNEGLKNAVVGAFQSLHKDATANAKTIDNTLGAATKEMALESAYGSTKRLKTVEKTAKSAKKEDASKGSTARITSFFTAKAPAKGSLEVTSRPSSKGASTLSLSTSDRSDRRQDSSSFKSLGKRPRVELTPSPHQRKKDRDRGTPPSSSQHRHKKDRPDRHDRSPRHYDGRPPKNKVELAKFVSQIEEKKHDPRTGLDAYLELERKEKEVIKAFKSNTPLREETKQRERMRTVGSSSNASSSSNRMRAGGQSQEGRRRAKHIDTKTLFNHFKSTPRPHADAKQHAEKAIGASKLDFTMPTDNKSDKAFIRSSKPRDDKHTSQSRDKDRSRDKHAKSPTKKGHESSQLMDSWVSKR